MVFCALAHAYFPDMINFDSLDPNDNINNCNKAFEVFEKAGIPRLLDGEDIGVTPEKRSIQTYVSTYA
jgi:hypothetical protein